MPTDRCQAFKKCQIISNLFLLDFLSTNVLTKLYQFSIKQYHLATLLKTTNLEAEKSNEAIMGKRHKVWRKVKKERKKVVAHSFLFSIAKANKA